MAKCRVEFIEITAPDPERAAPFSPSVIEGMIGSAEVVTATGASVRSAAVPALPSTPRGRRFYARLTAIDAAMIALGGGATPTVTQTNGVRLGVGATVLIKVKSGDKIALIAATD